MNDNLYNSATPKSKRKRCFNSDKGSFCDTAHQVTPEERQQALDNLQRLISKTKEDLNEN